MQVGVSPARVSSDAIQADHAASLVGNLQGLRSAHGLEERIQVPLQLCHEGIIIASSIETDTHTRIHPCADQDFKKYVSYIKYHLYTFLLRLQINDAICALKN